MEARRVVEAARAAGAARARGADRQQARCLAAEIAPRMPARRGSALRCPEVLRPVFDRDAGHAHDVPAVCGDQNAAPRHGVGRDGRVEVFDPFALAFECGFDCAKRLADLIRPGRPLDFGLQQVESGRQGISSLGSRETLDSVRCYGSRPSGLCRAVVRYAGLSRVLSVRFSGHAALSSRLVDASVAVHLPHVTARFVARRFARAALRAIANSVGMSWAFPK